MNNLWDLDTVQYFWLTLPTVNEQCWDDAIRKSVSILGLDERIEIGQIASMSLGEGRFGPDHWKLSWVKRMYYLLKPLIPRTFTRILRRFYSKPSDPNKDSHWPIDTRYPRYQWEVLRQILIHDGREAIQITPLWPDHHRYAFVLTHDIETAEGQDFVRKVADLEEGMGFRSSFNFVLERYPLDLKLMEELRQRGFEVGCHALKHDGKLFNSRAGFNRNASVINARLKQHGMTGFRAPLTHRNPEWMQELEIQYDLSFFDTDPFEPIPGGSMTIWPFFIGHFVELPYTLVQDYSLTSVLAEKTPRVWLDKVDFIEKYNGMVLINSHPDYLKVQNAWDIYKEFLRSMKLRDGYWHTLPDEVSRWWRGRISGQSQDTQDHKNYWTARLNDGELKIETIRD